MHRGNIMIVATNLPGRYATRLLLLIALCALAVAPCLAGQDPSREGETDPLVLAKLEWFQDMKFGLLMHWGPYSQWGVVESWSICPEDEDWCRRRGPHAGSYAEYRQAYENLKSTFNPVRFDPDSWAAAAKEAGMRYVVFTTKHHDGFCMFDTRETDYRITDPGCPFSANPRGDVTREIFDAFRRRGFGVGAYFSKPDWHSPDYWWPYFPPCDRNVNYDIAKYPRKWDAFKTFTFHQIEELMSRYGRVDILWLDGGWVQPMTPTSPRWGTHPTDQNIDMPKIAAMARALQPGLIIVDRAVEGRYQNYRTPEQEIPREPPGYVWETCMTMGTSWSYVPADAYKPARELIHTLVGIVAKGGNLLLNVGPSPEGELPAESLDRLEKLGAWMKVNGDAIYSTRSIAPYAEGAIRFTRMRDGSINAIYLAGEDEDRPPETIRISSFSPRGGSAVAMLGAKGPIPWEKSGRGFVIRVPESVRAHPPCGDAWTFRFVPGGLELVTNGRSDFSIYVGETAPPAALASADTLRDYLERISGARLAIVRAPAAKGRRIVFEIGASADPRLNVAALGSDGFRIRTARGRLFITAGTERGIRNAVYTFLETYLGCRKYRPTVEVVPKRATILLPDIDDTEVPPVTFRMQNLFEPSYAAWHKLNSRDDWGLFVHTFRTLVPPEKYFAEHPEYFSLLKGNRTPDCQLCLTDPGVFRVVVDELRARMRENPDARFWSVSQNDTYCPCECAACQAIDSAEGSPAGSILSFVNRVADEFPDKIISTLAYQYSRAAPRHIKPRPNVNVMLCSIECNRSRPIADDPASASFVKDVEDWSALTHNILLWDYVIQFRNLESPFPNLRVLQPNIRLFVDKGIASIFEQGFADMHGEFAELRTYLIAKLLWNPRIDVDSTMDDFLRGYYGSAAPHLRRYIDAMHDALAASGEELSIYGYPLTSRNGYLSPAMMETYDSLFDRAEDAARSEPECLFRVRTARLPIQFARLEQAKTSGAGPGGCFIEDGDGAASVRPEIESLLATFVERCREAEIPALWERGTSPDEYEAATRRFLDESCAPHLARSGRVSLAAPASPKYLGGDESALTDGIRGWSDYHTHWLGFEGEDMEATIDLGAERSVSSIGTDFLQDIESWIFMPVAVEFSVSEDGRRYRDVGAVRNAVPERRDGAVVEPFAVRFEPLKVRFVRVKAVNMKACPAWHKGAGGKAWIFIDEITVR
jgi:alpha-L-fucosidase